MAARASLAALIARVRSLIADPAGASPVFTDDEVQAALDNWRTDVRYLVLRPAETRTSGADEYLDYYASVGDWESDVKLYDRDYAVLTPDTSDLQIGHWTFAASTDPPVYLIGKTFDVYAAAADLLEAWAAKEKLGFDFTADGLSYSMSQKATTLLELAQKYRRQHRPMTAVQVRGDIR